MIYRKKRLTSAFFFLQLPELSNYIQEGGDWTLVLSQNLGVLTGTFIMLVIALCEHYAH